MNYAERHPSNLIRPPAPVPLNAPLGPFATMRLLRKNPILTWTKWHYELPILIGPTVLGTVAVINEPAAIRRMLVDNAANYRKDGLQRRVLGPGLGDGLLLVEGEDWRQQRHLLAPLFTPKTVAGFAAAIVDRAEALVSRWTRLRPHQIIDVQLEMAGITLDVLGKTIFSDGLGRDPEEFTRTLSNYFDTVGKLDPFDMLDLPDWVPRWNKWKSQTALEFFARAVNALILKRKRILAKKSPSEVPRDILTLLLEAQDSETGKGLSDAEVYANIVTFIGAGQETTANALTWSLFLLSLSEEWRQRLAAEAERVLDGAIETYAERLIETKAVIEEAMRLYPPVASIGREALGPDDLSQKRIRKGTLVMVSQWLLHRHVLLWDAPDRFDPRRFLPGAREKIDRFAYLPFGAGPRICIGASFALQEAAIILAHIMREFQLTLKPGYRVQPVQHITLRPEGGLPMMVRQRQKGSRRSL